MSNFYSALRMLMFASIFLVFVSSCKEETTTPTTTPQHWDYEHPDKWTEEGYPDCGGTSQSPINIDTLSVVKLDLPDAVLNYQPFNMNIIDNGHTIQVNNNTGLSSIMYKGEKYTFAQFHFHCSSEHTISGATYPMELHLVHKNAAGAIVVLGVFLQKGGTANSVIDKVFNNFPTKTEEVDSTTESIDLTGLLPTDQRYYTYSGSLTTPPCSQGVSFLLYKTPMMISDAQYDKFKAKYENNHRPVQALNGRTISEDTN
ncbi:MAG: carbonic anhydrase family protein [Candidatus Doudnabacteria bacterium]|nr:carbonic anhydrase family protein [Candidatus Doudnabacteria bacterium]